MLGEVRAEGSEHCFEYVLMDAGQSIGSRHASELLWGTLAKRYVEGGCELHVHFRAGTVKGGIAGDWCAVFNRLEDWLDFVGSYTFGDEEPEGHSPEKQDMRQPVLVLNSKLVKLPQEVVGVEPLASVVRLQPLDNCLSGWVDAPKHAIEFFEVLVATRAEDWECGVALDALRHFPAIVRQSQLKGEIIERRAEVMETVANNKAEFGGGRRFEYFDPKELIAAINIEFGPSSVRVFVEPVVHFRFKALQVVERPVEPSVVVEGHDRRQYAKGRDGELGLPLRNSGSA